MLGYQDASTWKDIEKLPHYFSGLTTNSESKLKSNVSFEIFLENRVNHFHLPPDKGHQKL